MARLGLSPLFSTLFANDFDAAKAAAYQANFGSPDFHLGDVHALTSGDLPGRAVLAWASSPCQDFSLAGKREGLKGSRSSAFYGFWSLMQALDDEGRAPDVIVVENVIGLLTSHRGADLAALLAALKGRGYRAGALEVDASAFSPQSRPRLFIVAARRLVPELVGEGPFGPFHSQRLVRAIRALPKKASEDFVWWRLPAPPRRNHDLIDLLEPDDAVPWHGPDRSARLLSLLSGAHRERLDTELVSGQRRIGAIFRRTRQEGGQKVQRAEIRFDGLAGCLRTPGGGSSKQFVAVLEGGKARTRDLTPRECARLMGLPDSYVLPRAVGGALHLCGDGVSVPAVRFLAENLLVKLARMCGKPVNP